MVEKQKITNLIKNIEKKKLVLLFGLSLICVIVWIFSQNQTKWTIIFPILLPTIIGLLLIYIFSYHDYLGQLEFFSNDIQTDVIRSIDNEISTINESNREVLNETSKKIIEQTEILENQNIELNQKIMELNNLTEEYQYNLRKLNAREIVFERFYLIRSVYN